MSPDSLSDYLARPMNRPEQDVLEAIERGPIDPREALALDDVERLLDPAQMPCETGWCTLPDGVAYVAVRTAMPEVSGAMVDWWFDWHPRDPMRYRVWHPLAHRDNALDGVPRARAGARTEKSVYESPQGVPHARARTHEEQGMGDSLQGVPHARAKAHWGAVHHPIEDVGTGMVKARIEFKAPTEMGMSSDVLDDPCVATIVCGYAGDDRLRVRHSPMFHVFLRDHEGVSAGDGEDRGEGKGGVILRSRFWLGAALRPYGPLGGLGEPLLNTPFVRRRALPKRLPQALARHCAEEYANLGALLPDLYERFGP